MYNEKLDEWIPLFTAKPDGSAIFSAPDGKCVVVVQTTVHNLADGLRLLEWFIRRGDGEEPRTKAVASGAPNDGL